MTETETPADLTVMGRVVKLEAPKSVVERYDASTAEASGLAQPRARALCLALAWPWLRRQLAKGGVHYRGNVVDYSSGAFAWLIAHGATWREIAIAGTRAFLVLVEDIPGSGVLPETEAEADELVGNSSGDTEGSPSTS